MLGKLIKYEIKATARTFLPLFAALLISAGIYKLISALSAKAPQAPEIISLILYNIILVGVFVMTFVVMVQRFYKNLLSDEGYLMFTLPVKAWKHIAGYSMGISSCSHPVSEWTSFRTRWKAVGTA